MAEKITILLTKNIEGAGLNRVRLLAQGLIDSGAEVKWIYLLNINVKNVFSKYLHLIIQIIKLVFIRKEKVLVYGYKPTLIFWLIRNNEIIIERNEYPTQLIVTNSKRIENISNYKYASKFITCSSALEEYYKKITKTNCKYLKIPLVVDFNKFANCISSSPIPDKEYIAYCGSMGNNKDGLYDLIKSFSLIHNKLSTLSLCLIGTAPKNELDTIKNKVKELGVESKVVFTGVIPHNDMPKYLSNAKLLLLSRPDNKQAEGGFPSKLGEYLSTGVPVLVTSVGEIPEYVKDGVNGYLSIPDDPEMFADKIIRIFDNYDEASRIGVKGQELAKEEFDYLTKSKVFNNFILN